MSKTDSPVPELPQIARGASFNFIGAISRSLLGFLYVFILARILSIEEMGLFFLAVNILMFSAIIGIAGLDAGLRRFVSIAHGCHDDESARSYFATAVLIAFPLTLFLATILYGFSDYFAINVFEKPELAVVLRYMTPFLFLYATAELLLSVTQGYKHMKYWVMCLDVLNNILRIGFAVLFSFLGMTLFGAVFGYVLAILFSSGLAYYYFRRVMPRRTTSQTNKLRFREMASFSFPVSLARLVNSGNGFIETILLGYFLVSSEVGVYTVALKVAIIGSIVLASFNTMFAPLISQLHAQGRLDELQRIFTAVTRWAFSLSLPVFMLVAWYAAPITGLFGAEYIAGETAVVVLCLGQLVNAITGPSGNLLLMSGHTYTNLWTNSLGLVLTVVLIIIFVPDYGIVGCAFAVGIAMSLTNITRVLLAYHFLRMHPYALSYWKPFAAATLVLLALSFLGPDRHGSLGILMLLATGVVATLLYALALVSLRLDDADRYVFNKIKQRFGGKGF